MNTDLTDRLDRLERANRRLRWIVLGLVGCTGFLLLRPVLAPPKTPARIDAREFRVLDQDGAVRAVLSHRATERGKSTELVIYGTGEESRWPENRMILSSVGLQFYMDSPKPTVELDSGKHFPYLLLSPRFGEAKAILAATSGNPGLPQTAKLELLKVDGKAAFSAP